MGVCTHTHPKEAFMQIKSLHRQLYTISSYALRHNSETLPASSRIASLVQKWQRLDKSGLQQLLTLRRSYPTYGKEKGLLHGLYQPYAKSANVPLQRGMLSHGPLNPIKIW
jgi:hypothetical protein